MRGTSGPSHEAALDVHTSIRIYIYIYTTSYTYINRAWYICVAAYLDLMTGVLPFPNGAKLRLLEGAIDEVEQKCWQQRGAWGTMDSSGLCRGKVLVSVYILL